MGISYQWHDGVTGDWQVATNWNPVGVPGSSDFATIGHQSQNTAQTVTGTGSAAALNAFATTTLAGNFSVGGNLTAQFTFQGAFTSFGSLTIDGGSIALGATLIADTLTLSVKNGAAVHALALALGANCNLTVDSASSVMIGSPGNATAGQLTIGSGVRVSVFEDIVPQFRVNSTATLSSPIIVNNGAIGVAGSARTLTIGGTNLINNGTINVTDGQLQILESGGVSGTGTVNVGSNSTLVAGYFGPGTGNTIHLSGITDNLQIPRRLWTLRIRSTRSFTFSTTAMSLPSRAPTAPAPRLPIRRLPASAR